MRTFTITQAQLDEIYEHPLPDHAYQILVNLPILKETVSEDDTPAPVVKAAVHETAGMWGEPKEELPLDDDRSSTGLHGLRGEFTFDNTVRFLEEEPMTNFFEQKITTYGPAHEPGPEVLSFREVMEREKEYKAKRVAAKEALKKQAHAEYARCEELKKHIEDLTTRIFERTEAGMTKGLPGQTTSRLNESLISLKHDQELAEKNYKAIMDKLWGDAHD